MFHVESKTEEETCYLYNEYGIVDSIVRPKQYLVYHIRDDHNGYPTFLIHEDGQWIYRSAKYFMPVENGE